MTPILGIMASQISGHLTTPNNYESISTTTLSSTASDVTFSSIPATYKHLQLRFMSTQSSGGSLFYIQLNADTGSNYAWHELNTTGAASATYSGSSVGYIKIFGRNVGTGGSANPTSGILDILDYTSTTKTKTTRSIVGQSSNGSGELDFMSGLWFATPAAINSIKIYTHDSTNMTTNTSFALYGVK